MKTIVIAENGATPSMIDTDQPGLEANQILVRLAATSINTTDAGTASGMFASFGMPHVYPVTLGRDFAGTVEAVGTDVTGFTAGDEVFGELPFVPPLSAGTWSEYVVADENTTVHRPEGVDVAVAGAAPLVSVTALMLADAVQFAAGETVLLVGATGGVGSVVAQLAAAAGAHVIAPALPDDEDYLHSLGVTEVISRDGDLVSTVKAAHTKGVDVIIDLVSYGATNVYDAALKPGGRVASATNAAGTGEGRFDVNHYPTPDLLNRTAKHLADGTIRIPLADTVTLADAVDALSRFGTTHRQGKVAITMV